LVQIRDNRYNRGSGTTMRPRNDVQTTLSRSCQRRIPA
jgi:hypothetical protein